MLGRKLDSVNLTPKVPKKSSAKVLRLKFLVKCLASVTRGRVNSATGESRVGEEDEELFLADGDALQALRELFVFLAKLVG